jgi:hypothetical protein
VQKRDIEMHNKKETPRAGRGVLLLRVIKTRYLDEEQGKKKPTFCAL